MNRQMIALVQESFAKVAPIADTAARMFYKRLFTIAPALRPLFPDDLTNQRAKLMKTLALAVRGLSRPEQVVPVVEKLGRRHLAYGVEDAHYDIVGAALIWTLEQGLGDAFTDRVREAWLVTYNTIAEIMKDAAAKALAGAQADIAHLNRTSFYGAPRPLPVPAFAFETPEFRAWLDQAAFGALLRPTTVAVTQRPC